MLFLRFLVFTYKKTLFPTSKHYQNENK